MQFLSEFPRQVLDSHALVVAAIMGGEKPSSETLLQLAAEAIAVDKMATLAARGSRSIQGAYDCWRNTCKCFQTCADLWGRVSTDDQLLAAHRRLLERLVSNAAEQTEFYRVSDHDRAIYNAGRDHGLPLPSPYVDA